MIRLIDLASPKPALLKFIQMLFAETFIRRKQDDFGQLFIQARYFSIMLKLQQIYVHQQGFAAACGALKTEFIQIIFCIKRHIVVINPITVEPACKVIQVGQQPLPVVEVAVKIYFREQQR